ncbi:MAG: hypothetical protein WD512_10385 [Candidatus Paceibacterota bacterium]
MVPNGSYYTEEASKDILYVDAVVSDVVIREKRTVLVPEVQAHRVGPVGIGFGGNIGIGVGSGMQLRFQTIPAVHQVTFTTKEGLQWEVNQEDVFEKFQSYKGKKVRVAYHPHYRTKWSRKSCQESKGVSELSEAAFLNATLIEK